MAKRASEQKPQDETQQEQDEDLKGAPEQTAIYLVRCGEYAKLCIDSGLPAGPQAEKIAIAGYKAKLGLRRDDLPFKVEQINGRAI